MTAAYSRVYKNGERLEIWTDSLALEKIMLIGRYLTDIYTPDVYVSSKVQVVYLLSHIANMSTSIKHKYNQHLNHLQAEFYYTRPIMLIVREQTYTEYHALYLPDSMDSAVNYHMNNLNIVHSIKDITSKLSGVAIENGEHVFSSYEVKKEKLKESENKLAMFSSLNKKEIILLHDASQGVEYKNNTANLTEESAKTYFKRIKTKLGVHKQCELISLYKEWEVR